MWCVCPGRNIIQLSSTIATQPIQMLVTPHPRRGHTPPNPHAAAPHAFLARRLDPLLPHATASRAAHCQARPTIWPTTAAPAHQSVRGNHVPARLPGRAGQPLQAKHIPPAAPVQTQDMLHCPTHPTANRSPAPGQGEEPQKEALEEGHHSTPRTGHPANPTPKPRRCPRMLATHPPVRHTSPHQTGWPAPRPKRSHISINTAHRPAKTPSAEPGALQLMDRALKPGTEIQGNPNDPERAENPAPAPDNPQEPNPNPSPDPDQKACSLTPPRTPQNPQCLHAT
ncbi:hypothetical protein XENOCAPTIV_014497 [Xenoophorus captivus]|uniref:Uncharacterized protein n=1 Tax=Xenoophorus captivus TaxID=1517983 RepID=A0ABV0Q9X2_9TELE